MPRVKRNKPHKVSQVHDRQARDLPRNAEVASVEIDNPLALEPGEKIVAIRSIRNDPLARLHSHRQIDEAQYRGGRAFQDDWEKAERGIRPANMSMAGRRASRSPSGSAGRCYGSIASSTNLAPMAWCWCMRCWFSGSPWSRSASGAACAASAGWIISRGGFANAWTGWR